MKTQKHLIISIVILTTLAIASTAKAQVMDDKSFKGGAGFYLESGGQLSPLGSCFMKI